MTKKTAALSGSWEDKNHQIEVKLELILFEEDNTHIAYCPALDLSGYGYNEEEAKESFKIVLDEFFTYTTHKSTFHLELMKLGWKIRSKNKPFIPPTIAELKASNDTFSNIIDNYKYKSDNYQVAMPA